MRAMFAAKRVPLSLLGHIGDSRDFHEQGFPALRETVRLGHKLESFGFYFDYVLALVANLEPFWDI